MSLDALLGGDEQVLKLRLNVLMKRAQQEVKECRIRSAVSLFTRGLECARQVQDTAAEGMCLVERASCYGHLLQTHLAEKDLVAALDLLEGLQEGGGSEDTVHFYRQALLSYCGVLSRQNRREELKVVIERAEKAIPPDNLSFAMLTFRKAAMLLENEILSDNDSNEVELLDEAERIIEQADALVKSFGVPQSTELYWEGPCLSVKLLEFRRLMNEAEQRQGELVRDMHEAGLPADRIAFERMILANIQTENASMDAAEANYKEVLRVMRQDPIDEAYVRGVPVVMSHLINDIYSPQKRVVEAHSLLRELVDSFPPKSTLWATTHQIRTQKMTALRHSNDQCDLTLRILCKRYVTTHEPRLPSGSVMRLTLLNSQLVEDPELMAEEANQWQQELSTDFLRKAKQSERSAVFALKNVSRNGIPISEGEVIIARIDVFREFQGGNELVCQLYQPFRFEEEVQTLKLQGSGTNDPSKKIMLLRGTAAILLVAAAVGFFYYARNETEK